eukprot:3434318-Pleurochrysis_carterae.AAC.2
MGTRALRACDARDHERAQPVASPETAAYAHSPDSRGRTDDRGAVRSPAQTLLGTVLDTRAVRSRSSG